jgi:hypothetical protein
LDGYATGLVQHLRRLRAGHSSPGRSGLSHEIMESSGTKSNAERGKLDQPEKQNDIPASDMAQARALSSATRHSGPVGFLLVLRNGSLPASNMALRTIPGQPVSGNSSIQQRSGFKSNLLGKSDPRAEAVAGAGSQSRVGFTALHQIVQERTAASDLQQQFR